MSKYHLIYRRGPRGKRRLNVGDIREAQAGDLVSYFRREGVDKTGTVVYGGEYRSYLDKIVGNSVYLKEFTFGGDKLADRVVLTLDEVSSVERLKTSEELAADEEAKKRSQEQLQRTLRKKIEKPEPEPEPYSKSVREKKQRANPKPEKKPEPTPQVPRPEPPKKTPKLGQCEAWFQVRSGWKQCTSKASNEADNGRAVCKRHLNTYTRGGDMNWEEPKTGAEEAEEAEEAEDSVDLMDFLTS